MSREYHEKVGLMHDDIAKRFAAGGDGVQREVRVRITDRIYVYLPEDGVHVQTQHVEIPDAWWERWPSEATVRRQIRSQCDLGAARITTMEA